MTNEEGQRVWWEDYYPFGSKFAGESLGGTTSYQFTGKEKDEETGLFYYGARYYDPRVGRFISEDPAEPDQEDPQNLNRYVYCRNNPLKYVDPTGKNNESLWESTWNSFKGGLNAFKEAWENNTKSFKSATQTLKDTWNDPGTQWAVRCAFVETPYFTYKYLDSKYKPLSGFKDVDLYEKVSDTLFDSHKGWDEKFEDLKGTLKPIADLFDPSKGLEVQDFAVKLEMLKTDYKYGLNNSIGDRVKEITKDEFKNFTNSEVGEIEGN